MDLNQFLEWQKEKKGRSVNISIGKRSGTDDVVIWVYDYELQTGQYVTDVVNIELENKKEKYDRELLARLTEKYLKDG